MGYVTPSTHVLPAKVKEKSALILVLMCLSQLLAGSTVREWPRGWSQARTALLGHKHYGFKSADLWNDQAIVTVAPDKTEITLRVTRLGAKTSYYIPATGLRSYTVLGVKSDTVVAWSERNNSQSRLYVQRGTSKKVLVMETPHFIEDVAMDTDDDGNLVLVWAGNEHGLMNIFLHTLDHDLKSLAPVKQLTSGERHDSLPQAKVQSDTLYLVYKCDGMITADILLMVINWRSGQLLHKVKLGTASLDSRTMPVLQGEDNGDVSVFWLADTISRGQAQGSVILYGRLDSSGKWLTPLARISERPGSNADLSVAKSPQGDFLVTWLNNSTGTFEVYHLMLSPQGSVTTEGPVTSSQGHKFLTAAHWGQKKVIMFSQIVDNAIVIKAVDDSAPAKEPLAFRLGLDPEMPLADALFKYVTIGVGSLTLASLALLGISLAVLIAVKVSPRGGLPQYLMVLALIQLLRRSGTILYYGAIFVPGWSGVIIAMGSALFAVGTVTIARLERNEYLTLVLLGFLFVFCDVFCSLFVRSAGQL